MPMSFTRRVPVVLGLVAVAALGTAEEKLKAGKPNAQMQAVLDEFAALGPKPIETLTPEEARKQPSAADAVKALLKKTGKKADPEPVGKVKDITLPGAAGPITARVYTPKGDGPFPVVVYFHGGGFVIATVDTYDASCRALCNAAASVVVSVEYRHAPEAPFPAAADDAFAAYQWVLKNAATVGGDGKRVAVAGESAGGNLATVVCLRARDARVPLPAYQVLIYPVTNNNLDTPSYQENAAAKPLMKWFFAHYVGNRPIPNPASVTPLQASSLAGLPPATVITAEIDPLRSEGKQYADALAKAGVKVVYRNYPGVTHEFFGMGAVLDDAKKAVAQAADGLKSAFAK